MELVDFLRARCDDDERAANTLDELGGWERNSIESTAGGHVLDYLDHFDSARMLADVAAKRRILDLILKYEEAIDGEWGDGHTAEEIAAGECPERHPDNIPAFRAMALPFAGQPDYDPAWTPE